MFYSRKRLSFINEKKGFTLLEMMVVVVIIGVLAGVAVPNVADWVTRYRLRSATRNLISNMIKAKSQAISENMPYVIAFNDIEGQDTYTITSGTAVWGPIELSPGHPEVEYDTISFNPPQLTFRSNGMVGQGGSITLTNDRGETYIITIRITGVMEIN
ncbi:MAG: GspH/FimT family pseudopilin [Deltaproteobacteria bacterium]|nr:MAG: GspH/FimT family pseudopilin [Deltaproteobacteria bacterium]